MPLRRLGKAPRPKAVTLVELMFALVIASFVSIAFMSSVIYMIRVNKSNAAQLDALAIASYYQGLVMASDRSKIGNMGLATSDFEFQFNKYNPAVSAIANSGPKIEYADPNNAAKSPQYRVWFEFTGFGTVASATANTLRANFPANQKTWKTNEWTGSYVTITKGFGNGQVMRVRSNTGDTLTLTRDLTGATNTNWEIIPNNTSEYNINNGRTVRLFVSWGDGSGDKTITRTMFLRRI